MFGYSTEELDQAIGIAVKRGERKSFAKVRQIVVEMLVDESDFAMPESGPVSLEDADAFKRLHARGEIHCKNCWDIMRPDLAMERIKREEEAAQKGIRKTREKVIKKYMGE